MLSLVFFPWPEVSAHYITGCFAPSITNILNKVEWVGHIVVISNFELNIISM